MGNCCGGGNAEADAEKLRLKKEAEEKAAAAQKEKEEEERKKAAEQAEKDILSSRPAGTHRDRIIALLAKYDPEKLAFLDPWLERLPNPRRREAFIRDMVDKHGPEPESKLIAMRECIAKHPKFKGCEVKVKREAYDKFVKCEPGKEAAVFEEIFGIKAKTDAELSAELGSELDKIKSAAFDEESPTAHASRKLPSKTDDKGKKQKHAGPLTCDPDLKDRIIAMLVRYDVERLATISEEDDYPDSDKGAELLFDLIEAFGEEPPSKKEAITALLREVFEEHDPPRLRSLPTIVAMCMSPHGMQTVRKILRQYGVVKVSMTQQQMIEEGIFGAAGKASSAGGFTPAGIQSIKSGSPFVPAWATGVSGTENKSFRHAHEPGVRGDEPVLSTYHKAHAFLDAVSEQHAADVESLQREEERRRREEQQRKQEEAEKKKKAVVDADLEAMAAGDQDADDEIKPISADDAVVADDKENSKPKLPAPVPVLTKQQRELHMRDEKNGPINLLLEDVLGPQLEDGFGQLEAPGIMSRAASESSADDAGSNNSDLAEAAAANDEAAADALDDLLGGKPTAKKHHHHHHHKTKTHVNAFLPSQRSAVYRSKNVVLSADNLAPGAPPFHDL